MVERETNYPLELLRAELRAALADQLVNLVDRFASKNELADLRAEMMVLERQTNGRFNVIDGKLNQLLAEKVGNDAISGDQKRRSARRTGLLIGVGSIVVALMGVFEQAVVSWVR